MKSVLLTEEGFDFLQLRDDGTVKNLKTNHVYDQGSLGVLVVWNKGKSHTLSVSRLLRKYFANEILDIPEDDKRSLSFLGLPNYTIVRDGRIWNHFLYNWVHGSLSKSTGYMTVKLAHTDGISEYKLHRLLAMAFKPCPNMMGLEIDHVDGNKTNNDLDNLEWVTTYENGHRARETGLRKRTLTDDQVHAFCQEWSTGKYKTPGKCARALDLSVTACEHIINHGTHTEIASLYGIPYKKPVRLTPVDWSRYPKSKYLKRPTVERSIVRTPSNCEDRLRASSPQS